MEETEPADEEDAVETLVSRRLLLLPLTLTLVVVVLLLTTRGLGKEKVVPSLLCVRCSGSSACRASAAAVVVPAVPTRVWPPTRVGSDTVTARCGASLESRCAVTASVGAAAVSTASTRIPRGEGWCGPSEGEALVGG